MSSQGTPKTASQIGIDNGYRALCPSCFARHDESKLMIRVERSLDLRPCEPCAAEIAEKAKEKKKTRDRGDMPRMGPNAARGLN